MGQGIKVQRGGEARTRFESDLSVCRGIVPRFVALPGFTSLRAGDLAAGCYVSTPSQLRPCQPHRSLLNTRQSKTQSRCLPTLAAGQLRWMSLCGQLDGGEVRTGNRRWGCDRSTASSKPSPSICGHARPESVNRSCHSS